jgi:two-component system, LytTR family, response regulator LytT
MNAPKILIAKDEIKTARKIATSLKSLGYQIAAITTGQNLHQFVEETEPDLILMDTCFSDNLDGIELAEEIKLDYDLPIILMADEPDQQLINRIKAIEPYGFIRKPYEKKSLRSAIEVALYNFAKDKERLYLKDAAITADKVITPDHLMVRSKNRLVKVSLCDILSVQACDNYSFIITPDQKYLVSYTLKEVNKKLPASSFIRTHRSFIINLQKVDGIEENGVIINNKTIPIGKSFRKDLMARFIFA